MFPRTITEQLLEDLSFFPVVGIIGPRQVGKTTLSRQLMGKFNQAQYLNWDVLADRMVLQNQSWSPAADLLVMDEIHKMPNWKTWL